MEQASISTPGRANWAITATLALSMLLAALGTSIANIALPTLAAAFVAPFPLVQGVVVAYLAALTVSTIIAGRLGDRHGLKRMHLAGLGLFAVSSLLCGLAPNLWLLIGARVTQGIGAAFLMTLSMALMRETATSERIGRAMGLLGTVSALGTALGPSLGGVLIPWTGWRGIFLVQVPLALLTLALAWASLPGSAAKGAAPMAGFRAPLLARNMAPNLAINLLVAAAMMTTLVVGPFYLDFGLGLQAQTVGLVMSVGPVISILGGVPAGRAVDAWGTQRILAVGLALLVAGALLLAVLPGLLGVAGYVLAIAALTPGYQLFQAANNTVALADAPKEQRGLASGLLSLSRNLGLIFGASAMGAVFAFGVGADFAQASRAAIAGGVQITFLLAAGMMLAAIAIAFGGPIAKILARSVS